MASINFCDHNNPKYLLLDPQPICDGYQSFVCKICGQLIIRAVANQIMADNRPYYNFDNLCCSRGKYSWQKPYTKWVCGVPGAKKVCGICKRKHGYKIGPPFDCYVQKDSPFSVTDDNYSVKGYPLIYDFDGGGRY